MARHLFTSESVTEGHPDKICDQISDSILDALLENDPHARVACETTVTTGLVLVAGEISTNTYVDIPKLVRKTVKEIGYDRAKYGFDGETCAVITAIDEQSGDIAMGVDEALENKKGEVTEDEILIEGVERLKGGATTSHNDHRIAMSLAVASAVSDNDIIIDDAESINKSSFNFIEQFRSVGGKIEL